MLSFVDESSITLKGGDYNIPTHEKHRVEWPDPDVGTIWLAIHY